MNQPDIAGYIRTELAYNVDAFAKLGVNYWEVQLIFFCIAGFAVVCFLAFAPTKLRERIRALLKI